jgi:ABC-type multidrug transport system fused ATPase/permease subunit
MSETTLSRPVETPAETPVVPPPAPVPADLTFRAAVTSLRSFVRPHRTAVVVGAVVLVSAQVLSLIQPRLVERIITAFSTHSGIGGIVGILIALVVGSAILMAIGNFVLMRAAEGVVLDGRRGLVHHMLRLPVPVMRERQLGDLMSRAVGDTTLLRQIVAQLALQTLSGAVMIVGTLAMMATVDVTLLCIALVVVVLMGGVIGFVMPRIRRSTLAAQTSVGAMGSALERALSAFTTVKASGSEAVEEERIGAAAREAYTQGVTIARWTSVAGTIAGLAIQVAFLVVLGAGGARVGSGAISVGTLVAFLLYLLYLTQPVLSLVSVGTYVQMCRAAGQRLAEVMALPTEPAATTTTPRTKPADRPAELWFDNVTFGYPGRDSDALHQFSLELCPGALNALVGPSGAGKTTTLGLVERFYEPSAGRILVDGRDVRDWDLHALRATIGYVEQDTPAMAGTLRENLTYAAPDATDEDLRRVLDATRLHSLLDRLGSLDAPVQQHGTSLSGGERQRVAIARALLRKPRLLLLDEATSQLDSVNEAALRDVITDLAGETTVLVVAHRLSTVRSAANITVVEDGRTRASGTHTELIRTDDLYAELVSHQLLV